MLDASILEQLREHFARVSRPVRLVTSLDESPVSSQMSELVHELASTSSWIEVVERADEWTPSFGVAGADGEPRVRFAGLPLGHEFTSLVLAILQVGGHPPVVEEALANAVRSLDEELVVETFFSQSCQNCPEVVQAFNLMSVLNPLVRHVAIDGASFRDEADARQVLAVPSVFVNGEPFLTGRSSLAEIIERLDLDAATAHAAELDGRDPYDVVVIGGGPAGASAAVYTARKGVRTALVAERLGGQVLDTMAIENLVSVPHTEGPALARDLERHVREYEVDIVERERVQRLGREDEFLTLDLRSGARLRARSVVVASGARWRTLNVPGETELLNRGVTFCPHCDGPLFKGLPVVVVGGGNSGVEAALDLAGLCSSVTLLEFDTQLRADDVLQRALARRDNVTVVTGAETLRITGNERMDGLVYRDRASGVEHRLEASGVFVQIGLVPNTDWLGDSLALSPRGEIIIDERGATSLEGVFAAGDCTTTPYKQIVVALGAGAQAALATFDYLIRLDSERVPSVTP